MSGETALTEIDEVKIERYINDRVDDQIAWYDKKSVDNQRYFKRCRKIELFSAALIPFLTGFYGDVYYGQILVGMLGLLIAIAAGFSSINGYQENWLNYRSACDCLKREKYLFLAKDVQGTEDFQQFVSRIESILTNEQAMWLKLNSETAKKIDSKN
jgi:hypothetical protein